MCGNDERKRKAKMLRGTRTREKRETDKSKTEKEKGEEKTVIERTEEGQARIKKETDRKTKEI